MWVSFHMYDFRAVKSNGWGCIAANVVSLRRERGRVERLVLPSSLDVGGDDIARQGNHALYESLDSSAFPLRYSTGRIIADYFNYEF